MVHGTAGHPLGPTRGVAGCLYLKEQGNVTDASREHSHLL